ncbi:MAG: glycerophosphodiester phosphodiesterase family protein [Bdellovibrionota bacterium]
MATPKKTFEVHGHRGARAHLPENTLEGFRYALEVGVDAIEIDVALTREKIPVVLHDRALNAALYRWKALKGLETIKQDPVQLIKDLPLSEIKRLDVGSIANPDFPEQRLAPGAMVPTLEAFVKLMMADPAKPKLNIEIKTHPFSTAENHEPEDFAEAIIGLLESHKVPYERVLLQSFDPASLLAVKDRDPAWPASFLIDAWSDDVPDVALELGVEAVSPRHDLLTPERLVRLRAAGLGIYVWTANTEADWERLATLGVDGIITDDPKACLAFRAR